SACARRARRPRRWSTATSPSARSRSGVDDLRNAWVCACDAAMATVATGLLTELGYAPDRVVPEGDPALTALALADGAEPELAVLAASASSLQDARAIAVAIRAHDDLAGLPLLVLLEPAALADAPALAEVDELLVAPASAPE